MATPYRPHSTFDVSSSWVDIHYCVSQTEDDLLQILELQKANHPTSLTLEEQKAEGFVSAQHDIETLRMMHKEYPHILAKIAIDDDDDGHDQSKIIGYALCMTRNAQRHISILAGLFETIDSAFYKDRSLKDLDYFVMGQVCIAKSFRGKRGIFRGLYHHMRAVMASRFDCIVTSIATRNPRSLRAHAKVGFKVSHQYTSFEEEWNIVLWDWKDPEVRNVDVEAIDVTVAESDAD